jgi:hypothetical protein
MTNLKKSYSVPALAILALAFCIMLLSQGVIAVQKSSVVRDEVRLVGDNVPLPAPAAKRPVHYKLDKSKTAVAIDGKQPEVSRSGRTTTVASAENGGETYATATVIPSVPYSDLGTTVGAAHDYDATLCGSFDGAGDVVYSITPSYDGVMYVSTCGGASPTDVDTKIWVVDAATLTEIACNDDDPDCDTYASTLTAPVVNGSTYYIVVGAYSIGAETAFEIYVDVFAPGTVCEAPIELTLDASTLPAQSVVAIDLNDGICAPDLIGASNALYYNFTSSAAAYYTFSWCDDGTTAPSVVTGIAGPLVCGVGAYGLQYSPGGCQADGSYTLGVVLVTGGTFNFEIFDFCEGLTGTLTIDAVELPLLNDDCADAIDLGVGDIYPGEFVHNVNATMDGPINNFCANDGSTCADVWYTWEADQTGYVVFDMCDYGVSGDNGFDSKMHIYRGDACLDVDPRESDPFGCSDDGCGLFSDGGLIELTCTAGERFLIRLAGWYDPSVGCAESGGMGTGELVIYQDVVSIRPPNDDCDDAVPSTLVSGVTTSEFGDLWYSSWDDCPSAYNDGTYMQMAWNNYHAFELTTCADLQIDFCGTPDQSLGYVRSQFTAWGSFLSIVVYTGCMCSGDFVATPAYLGAWGTAAGSGTCISPIDYTPDGEFNRVWWFASLLPGTYWFEASSWTSGARYPGGYYWTDDYQINFLATEIECAYCEATSNIAFCPPTANGSWMCDFSFADVLKDGDDGPASGATTPNDCHAYEDHTDMVAHVYRGLTYDLFVRMRKLTSPNRNLLTTDDSCTVFIDWNQNSGFAANQLELGERYTIPGTLTPTYFDRSLPITIPLDAAGPGEGATGVTALRVRISVGTPDGTATACGLMPTGEVEDYTVEVSDLECGDFNDPPDGIGPEDITFLRAYYFGYGTAPDYWQRADIDGDGAITIADIIALADAAYRGGTLNCI